MIVHRQSSEICFELGYFATVPQSYAIFLDLHWHDTIQCRSNQNYLTPCHSRYLHPIGPKPVIQLPTQAHNALLGPHAVSSSFWQQMES